MVTFLSDTILPMRTAQQTDGGQLVNVYYSIHYVRFLFIILNIDIKEYEDKAFCGIRLSQCR